MGRIRLLDEEGMDALGKVQEKELSIRSYELGRVRVEVETEAIRITHSGAKSPDIFLVPCGVQEEDDKMVPYGGSVWSAFPTENCRDEACDVILPLVTDEGNAWYEADFVV